MTDSTLMMVEMERIHPNPYRNLDHYPWIEGKIASLMKSIDDVGFWEGVIARRHEDILQGFEIAFGHHRIEAARRAGYTEVPLIVRDLTDEDMVKFMGRENGEDYKADFLVMLNSWEGAISFAGRGPHDAIDIARILGWTAKDGDRKTDRINRVAQSCANAKTLIDAKLLTHDDLKGLSVRAVRDICAPLISDMKRREKTAEHLKKTRPAEEVDRAMDEMQKKAVTATKVTAEGVRKGTVATGHLRNTTDSAIMKAQKRMADPVPPDFVGVVNRMCDTIDRMIEDDATGSKIDDVMKVVKHLPDGEYIRKVSALIHAIDGLKNRAEEKAAMLSSELESRKIKGAPTQQPLLEVVK